MEKLPKEAQDIIKYYGDQIYAPTHQYVAIFIELITELSPYLEDTFLPRLLTGENSEPLTIESRQNLLEHVNSLSSRRKESPQPPWSNH